MIRKIEWYKEFYPAPPRLNLTGGKREYVLVHGTINDIDFTKRFDIADLSPATRDCMADLLGWLEREVMEEWGKVRSE